MGLHYTIKGLLYMFRTFVRDTRNFSLETAWLNLRFNLGYRIGGFKHASRDEPASIFWTSKTFSSANVENVDWTFGPSPDNS